MHPDPQDFPREISRVSGNLFRVGDGFPNISVVLVEHRYSVSAKEQKIPPTLNFLKLHVKYSWYYGAQWQ